jgi:hypothetical protein
LQLSTAVEWTKDEARRIAANIAKLPINDAVIALRLAL